MPNLLIPIPVTGDPVMRRVAKSVVDRVLEITGINKSTRVELRGNIGEANQPGSELGEEGKTLRFSHDGRVIVTARETFRDSEVINAAVRDADVDPIFQDQAIGVHIKPVFSYTDVELNFTYRAKSKQEAFIWRDDIKIRLADNRQQHLHELEYHYPVPPWCSLLLKEVHTLRENVAGYGDSLGEYLRAFYTKRATVVTTLDGSADKSILVIAEKQIGVQGWFDFIEPIEEEKNDDGPSYNIQFTYKFNYKKPVEVNIQYPLTVHSQLISPKFIPKAYSEDPDKKLSYKGMFKWSLDTFDYEVRRPQKMLGGIMIPDFDEWIPTLIPNYTTSFINWMTMPAEGDWNLLFSEEDIINTGFDDSILAYMKRQGNRLVKLGQCALHFCLYRDDLYIADGDLEVIQKPRAFDIRTLSVPDQRRNYHMRLSFCTNIDLYTDDALFDMSKDGMTTLRIFQTVVNRLDVEDAQKNHISEDGELSIEYIKRFFAMLRWQRTGYHANAGIGGGSTGTGSYASNNNNPIVDGGGWLDDNSLLGVLDQPYVEILTILAGDK